MLEVVWQSDKFLNVDPWIDPGTGKAAPILLSQGDSSGYGQHADYVFGWKTNLDGSNVLQPALDCGGSLGAKSCGKAPLNTQAIGSGSACNLPAAVKEDNYGCKHSSNPVHFLRLTHR